ncbi:hypothetical protein JOB18_011112 [Solea senegalensis]|uniref:Uncharacterized protein n=1 Tax=Solea senegalensis TaxID=28829 RepID=A0AAV6PH84_SOLSE|nr:hypothetical protein JOB18_011112 [Solea senegalensis]
MFRGRGGMRLNLLRNEDIHIRASGAGDSGMSFTSKESINNSGLPLLVFTADLDLLAIQLRHAVNAKRGITLSALHPVKIIHEDEGDEDDAE